jgi:hypothetical protein
MLFFFVTQRRRFQPSTHCLKCLIPIPSGFSYGWRSRRVPWFPMWLGQLLCGLLPKGAFGNNICRVFWASHELWNGPKCQSDASFISSTVANNLEQVETNFWNWSHWLLTGWMTHLEKPFTAHSDHETSRYWGYTYNSCFTLTDWAIILPICSICLCHKECTFRFS